MAASPIKALLYITHKNCREAPTYTDGKGFITQLERAHRHGWAIEVVSWDGGCNRHLRQFAEQHGTYRSLKPVYDNITFINNKRWAQPL